MRRSEWNQKIRELDARLVKDARGLQRAFDEFASVCGEEVRGAVFSGVMDCFDRLVNRTPVATGRARQGWHIETAENDWKPAPGTYPEAQGGAQGVIARELAKLESFALSKADKIWIMNNVEYILALEAGWSKQSAGFAALFLQELKRHLTHANVVWI